MTGRLSTTIGFARLSGLATRVSSVAMTSLPPPPSAGARLARLKPETTALMICDIQERFRDVIHKFPAVVSGSRRMGEAAKMLSIPTIVTEQYPKGLGHTVAEFDATGAMVVEKTKFSMCIDPVIDVLKARAGLTDVVVCGIEAHVCVQQSTLDLIEMGYNVHLCVDAVSSSDVTHRSAGIHRCAGAGAYITTTESVLFELMRSKDHPSFKPISGLVKDFRPEDPLVGF